MIDAFLTKASHLPIAKPPGVEMVTNDCSVRFPLEELMVVAQLAVADRIRLAAESLEVTLLGLPKGVVDNPLKLLVSTSKGQPLAVLLCSNPSAPGQISRAASRIAEARRLLPTGLAAQILEPVAQGATEGLSWMLLPYCRTLSQRGLAWRLRRAQLRRPVLVWLLGVAATTCRPVEDDRFDTDVLRPLERLSTCDGIDACVRRHARAAMERLHSRMWRPRIGLVHNDLWRDNILLPRSDNPLLPTPQAAFYVIDWAGASLGGQPIYDLVRFSHSWQLSDRALRRRLVKYCDVLECSLADCMSALLVALGTILLNLEHFPLERFVVLAHKCHGTFARVLGGDLP